ncbi:MAG: ATP-binding protein [Anaerolineae bacterium]|nr:ATP-binding protein [Anaerolineae bacterium]MCB9106799.1 ATP-binding protein [Anaerolineales bacterium]
MNSTASDIDNIATSPSTSALATTELVGREDLLADIEWAIGNIDTSHVFYIEGPGGIGKTRLVRHFVDHHPKRVLVRLVDLHDIFTNTVEGLINRIQKELTEANKDKDDQADYFKAYRNKRLALDQARMTGQKPNELRRQRNKMITAFFSGLRTLAKRYRIVLIFDTTEKLFYRENPIVEKLGLTAERPEVLSWLVNEFFAQMPTMVVLLAGRPSLDKRKQSMLLTLADTFDRHPDIKYRYVPLHGLNEAEALAYFEAVIHTATQTGDPKDIEIAEAIQSLPESFRRGAFHSLRDEDVPPRIRPILLAIVIDHLCTAGQPLEQLTQSTVEQAQALTRQQRDKLKKELGLALINTLRNNAQPADRVLITLSALRLGADAALLGKIIDDDGENQAAIEAAIIEVQKLSFVKTLSGGRIVLHDEMYDLLQPYQAETGPFDRQRDRILTAMENHYRTQIKKIREKIYELTMSLTAKTAEEIDELIGEEIITTKGQFQTAVLEDLHYRLRRDAQAGFQAFYRYGDEAVTEGDVSFGMQLQAEVYSFLSERDPEGQKEEIDGLRRADVDADAAIRQLKWFWIEDQKQTAVALAQTLRTVGKDIITAGGQLALAELNSWRGYYLEGYEARYTYAKQLLERAIQPLETISKHSIRSAAILARAYNNLGYICRIQGLTHEAIQSYRQALRYWRAAHFRLGQADTLNNLSYALALIGDFEAANRHGIDALALRSEYGPRIPVGLSFSTLAQIDINRDYLDRALRRAQQAHALFSTLNYARGTGLALIGLAETKRRLSRTMTNRQRGQSAQLLAEANDHAKGAARIFEDLMEPDHRVKALIELGCADRDWALRRCRDETMLAKEEEVTGQVYKVETLVEKSEQTFQKAIEVSQGILDLNADALYNLAVLYYLKAFHLGLVSPEEAIPYMEETIYPQIEAIVLDHFRQQVGFDAGHVTQLLKSADRSIFLMYMGRLEILRGRIATRLFNQSNNQDMAQLQAAAQHYTLALAYHSHYSENDFREMRVAREKIYESFSKLTTDQLTIVFETVEAAEQQYNLGRSQMSKFLENNLGFSEPISIEIY